MSYDANGATTAFFWANGKMTPLEGLQGIGSYSYAYGINNQDQIVGNGATSQGSWAVLWQNGQITELGDLPGGPETSMAYAINDAGQVVGESAVASAAVGHAFIWQNGVMTDLGRYRPGERRSTW